jgi:hypothetical protein
LASKEKKKENKKDNPTANIILKCIVSSKKKPRIFSFFLLSGTSAGKEETSYSVFVFFFCQPTIKKERQ